MRQGKSRALAVAVVTMITLTGCSGGDSDKPRTASSPSATPSTAAPEPTPSPAATVTTVTGRLNAQRRAALADAVAKVVDSWIDGAYLGDFPRSDYAAAFAGFTPGAAAKANRDLALMTNAGISDQIDKAEETRRTISLDVLSLKQRPVGVTATVDLAFATSGTLTGAQQVTGTLDLTPAGDSWKIFGFAITRRQA